MEAKTLALYLGCQVKTEYGKIGKLSGLDYHPGITTNIDIMYSDDLSDYDVLNDDPEDITRVKLLLRPLSSMTDKEKFEAGFGYIQENVFYHYPMWGSGEYTAKTFQYLLSRGFDLFGLIEKGEALDATKPQL